MVTNSTVKAEEGIAGINKLLDNVTAKQIEQSINKDFLWTSDKVNMRLEATTKSDIIITLEKRVRVHMISSSGDWTKVIYKDKIGYVYTKYLRDTELPSLDFTDEEIDLLAKILWLEAKNQDDKGIAACAIVIFNRIKHVAFSDTMYEVLSDKNDVYEFSTWKKINTAKPDARIYEIIDEVINGLWDGLLTEDYVYFSTKARNNNGTIKIGDHFFCKIEVK
jgi:hypothetical protein